MGVHTENRRVALTSAEWLKGSCFTHVCRLVDTNPVMGDGDGCDTMEFESHFESTAPSHELSNTRVDAGDSKFVLQRYNVQHIPVHGTFMALNRQDEFGLPIAGSAVEMLTSINDQPKAFDASRKLAEESTTFHQHHQGVQNQDMPTLPGIKHLKSRRDARNESYDILLAERLAIADRLEQTSYYEAYPTTLALILLAHVVFLYQWNKRKGSREVMVSYRTIVQKRQYHRAILAVLSHPPIVDTSSALGTSNTERIESNDIAMPSFLQAAMGNGESVQSTSNSMVQFRRFLISAWPRIQSALHPFTHGQLSGLPLLFYASHLLWSCRALEPAFDSSWCYARVLLGLTVIGLLLELRVTHNLLRNITDITSAYQSAGTSPTRNLTQTQQILLHRGMGTLSVLCSGVLILFHSMFPYIPLQVFPFVDSTIRWWNPFMSYLFCLCVLTTLSWKLHPVTSVLFGTLSGCLWSSGVTSFLGESYWGSSMIVVIVLICLLSVKVASSASRRLDWLPCIDYVGWDHRGQLRSESPTTASTANSRGRMLTTPIQEIPIPDDDSLVDDDEIDNTGDNEDIESHPLLASNGRASIEPTRNDGDELHGRLPVIDMDDETLDGAALPNHHNANVRSRRTASNVADFLTGRDGRNR